MNLIWTWLTSKLAGPIGFGLAAILLVAFVFTHGELAATRLKLAQTQLADATAQKQAIEDAAVIQQSIDSIGQSFAIASIKADALIAQQTYYVEKEISRYVTPEVDHSYPLPNGLVWLHDAAIEGVDPTVIAARTGGTYGEASTFKASDLAANDAENFGLCRLYRSRAEQLAEYANTLVTRWNALRAQYSALER